MAPPVLVLEDRYRLDDRIAVGGMGEVWRATDLVLGRPVAVKLLRPAFAQDDLGLARFRAEARYAGSLSHPNIAHIYDCWGGEPPGQPYLVMELVDGPSLAGLLAAGPLSPERTLEIIGQAAAGLQAAHAAGLVHRDIKPGNLLLTQQGQVKIADFGIAHAAGSAPVTRTGELIGTPAYLSPEQATGRSATPASDLYALGIVAYQCLAGEPPFTGEPLAVALAHQDRHLPALPAGVAPGVAAFVSHLAAKNPAARPASAGEVSQRAHRLRAALNGDGAALPRIPAGGPPPVPATVADVPAPAEPADAVVPGPRQAPPADGDTTAEGATAAGGAGTAVAALAPMTAGVVPLLAPAAWPPAPTGPAGPPASAGATAPAGPEGRGYPLPPPGSQASGPWRVRRQPPARAVLVTAGIVLFGLAGWAMSSLPGQPPGPQRPGSVPVARPTGPATGPGIVPGGPADPQTVATPGSGPRHSHPASLPRHSASPSPSGPAPTSTATTAPPTPGGAPSPSVSPSPTLSATPAPSPTATG